MAMASAPVIRASCSVTFFFSSTGTVNVAIFISPCLRAAGPLAFCSHFQDFGNLFLVLTAITETMRAFLDGFGFLDGRLQPFQVAFLVLPVGLPLAVLVIEFGFVDHRNAVVDRANLLAHTAATAGLQIDVVGPLGGDVERSVGTIQPAQGALRAGLEVN